MRFDADVEAQQNLRRSGVARQAREAREFFDSVHGDAAGSAATDGDELVVVLPGAVQRHALRRKAGALSGDELSERADVEADGSPREVAQEFDRRKRLRGVGYPDAERTRAPFERVQRRVHDAEVHDEQGRPELLREALRGDLSEYQVAVWIARLTRCQRALPGRQRRQNCSMKRSICSCAIPAAMRRSASSPRFAGGVTNMNGALLRAARTVHHCEPAAINAVW